MTGGKSQPHKPYAVRDLYHSALHEATGTGGQYVTRPWGMGSGVSPRPCEFNHGSTTREFCAPRPDILSSSKLQFPFL